MMIVLRRPIVNLLFQYGQFGPEAREATQEAFLFYSLGLAGTRSSRSSPARTTRRRTRARRSR